MRKLDRPAIPPAAARLIRFTRRARRKMGICRRFPHFSAHRLRWAAAADILQLFPDNFCIAWR
jgi:hypothetical protein